MMILLLALLDWFSVYQYAPKAVALRGCSECKGEPDDLCEVRSGAQVRRVDELRSTADGRVYLLRSKADPDCAVPAKALLHAISTEIVRAEVRGEYTAVRNASSQLFSSSGVHRTSIRWSAGLPSRAGRARAWTRTTPASGGFCR